MPPALLLLAAGGSTRMGRAKQLLPYRNTTLLGHSVRAGLDSRCHPVTVILGAEEESMRSELAGLPLRIVNNPLWAAGMGTSIRAGLTALLADLSPPAVIIMLCDQPAVTGELLNQLIDRYERGGAPIVASSYGGIAGVPALFDACFFGELLSLDHSAGARVLIQRHAQQAISISFPQGAIDVDTPEEYERLK